VSAERRDLRFRVVTAPDDRAERMAHGLGMLASGHELRVTCSLLARDDPTLGFALLWKIVHELSDAGRRIDGPTWVEGDGTRPGSWVAVLAPR